MAFAHNPGFPRIGAVHEFTQDQRFELNWAQLFDDVIVARSLGRDVKPVITGPLTYLWLGTATGGGFDKLELLERLLPVYGQALTRLAETGVEWVQIDEPILSLDLPQEWKNAFERAYNSLQYSPLKKLISTSDAGFGGNLGLVATLQVQGLHVDLVSAPQQMAAVLDRLPTYKVLSLGEATRLDAFDGNSEQTLQLVKEAEIRFGDNLWIGSPHALLHRSIAGLHAAQR